MDCQEPPLNELGTGVDETTAIRERQNEYKALITIWEKVTKNDVKERFLVQTKMYPRALEFLDKAGIDQEDLTETIKKNAEEDLCLMLRHILHQKKLAKKRTRQEPLTSIGQKATKAITHKAIKILKYEQVAYETDDLATTFHIIMNYVYKVMKEVKLLIPHHIRGTGMDSIDVSFSMEDSNKENADESIDMEGRPSRLRERKETPSHGPHQRSLSDRSTNSQSVGSSSRKNQNQATKKKEQDENLIALPATLDLNVTVGNETEKEETAKDEEAGKEEERRDEPDIAPVTDIDDMEDTTKTNTDDEGSMCRDPDELSEPTNSQQENVEAVEGRNLEADRTTWMHRDRLPEDKVDTHCFICREEKCATNDSEVLTRCDKRYTSATNTRCNTRFHMSCLKEYNAGDYDVFYLQGLHQLQKPQKEQIICPLHHCDLCYFERMKNTAVKGEHIQCKCCYRAFHKECRPAGANLVTEKEKITVDGTDQAINVNIQKTICHAHPVVPYNKLTKNFDTRIHTQFCCECEQFGDKEKLVLCSQCVRCFHLSCRSVDTVMGNRYSDGKAPLCESCIHGESVRIGIPVICRFQNSYYAAVSVPLERYPTHCASADKYGKYLNKPGFVAVEWAGCVNLFSLIPAQAIIPMFSGSFDMIGKRVKDEEQRNAWMQLEKDIIVPRPVFEDDDIAHIHIKTSVYHVDCAKPRLVNQYLDDVMCECPESDPSRCSTDSKCANRAFIQECPEACEKKGSGCNNRDISRKTHHPSIKVVKTAGKGFGVIALDDIPKEAFIAEYAGELISQEERNKRVDLCNRSRNDEEKHYMMQLDVRRVIDCKRKGNIARFLNHSCSPNCKVDTVDIVVHTSTGNKQIVRYDKRTRITALREIKKGEELCFNYNMEEYNAGCPLPVCKCNSENCTGRLGLTVEDREAQRRKKQGKDSRTIEQGTSESAAWKPKETSRKRKTTETPSVSSTSDNGEESTKQNKKTIKSAPISNESVNTVASKSVETSRKRKTTEASTVSNIVDGEEEGMKTDNKTKKEAPKRKRKLNEPVKEPENEEMKEEEPQPDRPHSQADGNTDVPVDYGTGKMVINRPAPYIPVQKRPEPVDNNVFINEVKEQAGYIQRLSNKRHSAEIQKTPEKGDGEEDLQMYTPIKDDPPVLMPNRTARSTQGRQADKFSP